ncbi:choloylglycine hydrolase [Exophiala viscosa]|uniref:Choloylglycine hydrolase n=1 Tax=Exophiala viscosa TaxID=2486360 RepID=A0AAN6IFR9_9EURO|nr:choloylglycine hydrolase [Exophiala viscosa]
MSNFKSFVPLVLQFFILQASACSRVAYTSGAQDGNRTIIGRSMDWLIPTNSSLYAFPAGIQRNGRAGNNSVQWISKYGSVITTAYDLASVDGMNTEGLVVNMLYLADGDYGARNSSKPAMSLSLWLQYFLDNYATASEAASDLYDANGEAKYQVRSKEVVQGVPSLQHLSIGDAMGDNLILEWIDGKLVSHHSKDYTVMTNEPQFTQQLAINDYWSPISNSSLPGTDRPADRFARLSHYRAYVPVATDMISAVANTAGMIRAVSVPNEPTGISTPNISPTLWRTYSDTLAKTYFWESATTAFFFWTDLSQFDLSKNGTIMRLPLMNVDWTRRVGDMKANFVKAPSFNFLECDS